MRVLHMLQNIHVHVHVVLQVTLAPILYILMYRKLFRVESGEVSSVSEADGRVTITQWNVTNRTTPKSIGKGIGSSTIDSLIYVSM